MPEVPVSCTSAKTCLGKIDFGSFDQALPVIFIVRMQGEDDIRCFQHRNPIPDGRGTYSYVVGRRRVSLQVDLYGCQQTYENFKHFWFFFAQLRLFYLRHAVNSLYSVIAIP